MGWFPRGVLDKIVEDIAFALEVGRYSGVLRTSEGYEIIKVEGHEMERELDPVYLAQRRAAALDDWLSRARNSDRVENLWSPEKVPPEETPKP